MSTTTRRHHHHQIKTYSILFLHLWDNAVIASQKVVGVETPFVNETSICLLRFAAVLECRHQANGTMAEQGSSTSVNEAIALCVYV